MSFGPRLDLGGRGLHRASVPGPRARRPATSTLCSSSARVAVSAREMAAAFGCTDATGASQVGGRFMSPRRVDVASRSEPALPPRTRDPGPLSASGGRNHSDARLRRPVCGAPLSVRQSEYCNAGRASQPQNRDLARRRTKRARLEMTSAREEAEARRRFLLALGRGPTHRSRICP